MGNGRRKGKNEQRFVLPSTFYHLPSTVSGEAKMKESKRRILVVDDEESVRDIIARTITRYYPDCEVFTAKDGAQGMEKLMEIRPSLVIVDVCMPNMDGKKMCRLVQSHPWFSSTHILAITGYPSPKVRESMFDRGAGEFLPKPFALSELLSCVTRLI